MWLTTSWRRTVGIVGVTVAMVYSLGLSAAWGQRPPEKRALVIGINRYLGEFEGVPELHFAAPDAQELSNYLRNTWDTRTVINEEATRSRIVSELVNLAKTTEEQDIVLIYFAGHGVRDSTAGNHTYWLTYTASLPRLAVEGIRLSHLLEYVSDIPARRKVIILDHCHSGDVEDVGEGGAGTRDASGEVQITRKLFPKDDFQGSVEERFSQGLVILGSAREEAYEFPDLGHGVYTHSLLEALKDANTDDDGNGKISIFELLPKVSSRLQQTATAKNIRQVSVDLIRGQGVQDWEFFDVVGTQGDVLRDFVTRLDNQVSLKFEVRVACFQAISSWEANAATQQQLAIVEELKALSRLGAGADAQTKKQLLEGKVESLP